MAQKLSGPKPAALFKTPRALAGQPLDALASAARRYLAHARAPSTNLAYSKDWKYFCAWARSRNLEPITADSEAIALYCAALAERVSIGTIKRRLAAIRCARRLAGQPPFDETLVSEILRGIARLHYAPSHGKAPLVSEDLRSAVEALPKTLLGARNAAMLLLGFAGALRRSELVALDVDDAEFRREGLLLTVRRSKTDQASEGREIAITPSEDVTVCPVAALRIWLERSGPNRDGPLFVSLSRRSGPNDRLCDKTVARVVKQAVRRAAEASGLSAPEVAGREAAVAGHSLRAGFVTQLARAGAPEYIIQKQTRHANAQRLRDYIRRATPFEDDAGAFRGL